MTKLSFSVSPVALAAQGKEFTVDPAEFSPVALEGIMAYGIRRWFQDHINSAAHAVKKAKEEAAVKGEAFTGDFDIDAAFAARLESAKTGNLSPARAASSSPAFTPLEETIYALAVEIKAKLSPLAAAWSDSKGLPTAERKATMLKAVAALPDAVRGKLTSAAQTRLDALSGLDL